MQNGLLPTSGDTTFCDFHTPAFTRARRSPPGLTAGGFGFAEARPGEAGAEGSRQGAVDAGAYAEHMGKNLKGQQFSPPFVS